MHYTNEHKFLWPPCVLQDRPYNLVGNSKWSCQSYIDEKYQKVPKRKSDLYRFATIGDKILIALALIAASGVGVSQAGNQWNIFMESLSVITYHILCTTGYEVQLCWKNTTLTCTSTTIFKSTRSYQNDDVLVRGRTRRPDDDKLNNECG